MAIYIGIVDAHGIKSFLREYPESAGELRAMVNHQRHEVVYRVELDDDQAREIEKAIADGNHIGALERLKNMDVDIEFSSEVSVVVGFDPESGDGRED